jgi:hypothetical protein
MLAFGLYGVSQMEETSEQMSEKLARSGMPILVQHFARIPLYRVCLAGESKR